MNKMKSLGFGLLGDFDVSFLSVLGSDGPRMIICL